MGGEFSQPITRIHAGYFTYIKLFRGSVGIRVGLEIGQKAVGGGTVEARERTEDLFAHRHAPVFYGRAEGVVVAEETAFARKRAVAVGTAEARINGDFADGRMEFLL